MDSVRRLVVVLIIGLAFQNSCQVGTVGQGASWVLHSGLGLASASADEGWKREFEHVCARAGDQEGLSIEDLKALLARCDTLKIVIEGLEESTRKVYLARLQACRDLYRYMLDAKEKGGSR